MRTILAVSLMFLAASVRASDDLPYIGGEQEVLRRAEGRVQRAVLDRLLGAGQGSIRLEKQSGFYTASIIVEKDFAPEVLDQVRKDTTETLGFYKMASTVVSLRLRDGVEQAIEDAQYAIYEGSLDKAMARAKDAVKADPKNVTAWEVLGSVYFLQGEKEKARQTWTKVMTMDPGNRVVPAFLEKLG